ncbi:MAG: DegT/DnrJ/EryC1/StrS family aminotransferase [Desulfobacterota bacterium]|nr:DegT/DnrJ/EryC1/StrS family aminotransferase [Thermodesulfobacteriota bacterium]
MKIPLVNLKAQYRKVKKEILAGLKQILDEQKLVLGEYCQLLEEKIATYIGVPYAISCANGTDALILSLRALDIGIGDEVITTPYTFFSTASSITLVGAKPVFVDIEPRFMNIDPTKVEDAITERTRAIIVVHLFGKICQIDKIMAIAEKHKLYVIEDMAQSIGAKKDGKMAGSFGHVSALSFYPTKNLGGIGEGGMVLTYDESIAKKAKKLRVHGMDEKPYTHDLIGINSRLDEIKAYALCAKFPYLEEWNKKRIENAKYYNSAFKDLPLVLPELEDDGSHVFHQYVIRTEKRDELKEFLEKKGIQTGIYYPLPLHLQKCFLYLGYKKGDFPCSEEASRTSLAIPVYPELKEREKEYIVRCVKKFFKR